VNVEHSHKANREMEHLTSEMERLEWRRDKVQELSSKGYSQREIAKILQVGLGSAQVIDTSRPVSLAIHLDRNNSTTGGQLPNNVLKETVRNPNGVIMTSNEFTKQIFTTFKPDITGKYIVTIYNSGNSPVSIGVLAGNLPFIGANNKVNFNSLTGIITGIILTIAGIIVLIAGVIVLILDRRRIRPRT
jgi:hypothetical protein